jgi:hypothetical protein
MRLKWEKVGTIGVDAGLCWVGDPCYVMGKDSSHGPKTWKEFCDKNQPARDDPWAPQQPLGPRVGFAISAGYGDGEYSVYVVRGADGRIKAVKVRFF